MITYNLFESIAKRLLYLNSYIEFTTMAYTVSGVFRNIDLAPDYVSFDKADVRFGLTFD